MAADQHQADLPIDTQITLTGGTDFWHTAALPERGLSAIQLSDGPHGLRAQADDADNLGLNDSLPATCFPPAVGLAATWSTDTATAVAGAIAEEALAYGIAVVLGPGMNIKRSPLCGRNFEYFSEDPHLAGELATAYVNGLQDNGVGASIKHFALNNQETDRMRVDVDVDERTMNEIYLRAFRTVVTRAQPWTVMSSYNSVAGQPVASNRFLLTDVLREQWGFTGAVVSDWGSVTDRAASVAAGLDLQMPADPAGEAALRAGVENGTVLPEALNRAAEAVAGLIAKGASSQRGGASFDAATRDAHHEVARTAAQRAIVLLQNDGLLPLDPHDPGLAVVGDFARHPRYQGGGSSHVNATRVTTALDAIEDYVGAEVPFEAGFTPGGSPDDDAALRHDAVDTARNAATVVVFLGLGDDVESEGFDRTDLALPATQIRLLSEIRAVNPSVVVVLSNGAPVRLPGAIREQPAVLESWLLGQAGGQAVADVLFGQANPSGKLPESLPLRLTDLPSTLHFPGERSRVRYGEGLFVGYRGLDAIAATVAYPFGHGLSYTTFDYEGLDVATDLPDGGLRLSLTVKNTGTRWGREVVQAYVSVPDSAVARPVRELKGFADVELAPGQAEHVTIEIPYGELAYWDVLAHDWVVESAEYTVEVGASSRDLRVEARVSVVGDEPVRPVDENSTVQELLAIPGADELLSSLGSLMSPELMGIAGQIPVGRFTGLGGVSPDQIQGLLAAVNALRG